MDVKECSCPHEMAFTVQFKGLREDLKDLKDRVARLESTLARGVLLLVANLAGMVVTLAHQLL